MSGITYADLIKQYATLDELKSRWAGKDCGYLILFPTEQTRRTHIIVVNKVRQLKIRARVMKHRKVRYKIVWK